MLTWEFPPRSVGGLARHVDDLSTALARKNVEVHVVTCGTEDSPAYEVVGGVHVHRFEPYPVDTPDFLTWALQLNIKMMECTARINQTEGPFDIIHAHDWLAAFAGGAAKHAYQLPMVATIHATEAGRNNGLHTDQQRYISSVEWWLAYEAWRVIVCSKHMRGEIKGIFDVPTDKIEIIPNGVNAEKFRRLKIEPGFKQRFAAEDEKIVFFVGRLVQEKGVQVLVESTPSVLRAFPRAKFVIAGTGPKEAELRYRVNSMGLQDKVYFAGYIDDATRNKLYATASGAVIPSLYEPFGIVALEGMAAGTPVVVSDVGGLSEIVTHGKNGLKAYPGHPDSLANNLLRLLTDEVYAAQIRNEAKRLVEEVYDWNAIAEKTLRTYHRILREYRRSSWNKQRSVARVWDYAISLVSSRYEAPERSYREPVAESGRYDIINSRITSNNHREGGH